MTEFSDLTDRQIAERALEISSSLAKELRTLCTEHKALLKANHEMYERQEIISKGIVQDMFVSEKLWKGILNSTIEQILKVQDGGEVHRFLQEWVTKLDQEMDDLNA